MELVGHVSVDAGMVMVGDPCYLDGFQLQDANDFGKVEPYPYSYDGAASATLSEARAGVLGEGLAVAVSTYAGDGDYPVYVTRDDEGRVTSLTVVFDQEPAEDEDEDEGLHACEECGMELTVLEDSPCDRCVEDQAEFEAAHEAIWNGEDPG